MESQPCQFVVGAQRGDCWMADLHSISIREPGLAAARYGGHGSQAGATSMAVMLCMGRDGAKSGTEGNRAQDFMFTQDFIRSMT